jgi:hypothetical protein
MSSHNLRLDRRLGPYLLLDRVLGRRIRKPEHRRRRLCAAGRNTTPALRAGLLLAWHVP